MQILGLQKTTLLDYPGHLAATIFLGGCNFRCPFCHNRDLVLPTEHRASSYSHTDILSFLQKRQGILEGVCITGGEPTLWKNLPEFIKEIKKLGYLVKLDTNGTNPSMLHELIEFSLINYIAMDIKTDKFHYQDIANCESLKIEDIEQSISSIKTSGIPYEFRTTVVKELHSKHTFLSIRDWIGDCHLYALQPYRDSENVIIQGFHSVDWETLLSYQRILAKKMQTVIVRGMDS